MAADPNPDLIQAAKPLLPSLLGVVFGMFARWSREAKAGRVKSFRRMMLLDLPTLGALTLAAGSVAQRMDADPLTTAGIGCAAGYVGIEVLNAFVSWRLKGVAAPTQGRG